ncbi:MAG: sensor histidine kinase [Cyclobacteriaceae bacterium]|nr:sensor histidine kinase [Cyclobacteriaceae bacterium]
MKFSALRQYVRIVLISLAGSALTTYFSCPGCASDFSRYVWVTLFSATLWISLWIGNGAITNALSRKVSWVAYPLKRFGLGVVASIVYTVSVTLLITLAWERWLHFTFGNYFSNVVLPSLIITTIVSLFLHSRSFLLNWREMAVNAERLQRTSVQAQYATLRSQVNPHFLFNSLNALTNLVHQDPDKAVKFIKQLADVYRYVLDTRDKELVSVEEEMRFLESYLFLQQIRFGDKLQWTVDRSGARGQVAPLALQMLIENAIKHNVIAEEQPLRIRVFAANNHWVVENNLQRKKVVLEEASGMGLDNIRKRYGFLTSVPMRVEEAYGLFRVSIPFID